MDATLHKDIVIGCQCGERKHAKKILLIAVVCACVDVSSLFSGEEVEEVVHYLLLLDHFCVLICVSLLCLFTSQLISIIILKYIFYFILFH